MEVEDTLFMTLRLRFSKTIIGWSTGFRVFQNTKSIYG